VISKVVDVKQSAFLEGRGLLDSVVVANEVLEEMKRRKKRCVFFKVDFEKAYDSVRWEFIYYMLEKVGFCDKWIQWIKGCLESASMLVLVNGSLTKEFFPKKVMEETQAQAHMQAHQREDLGQPLELWPRGSKKTFFYMFKCHKL